MKTNSWPRGTWKDVQNTNYQENTNRNTRRFYLISVRMAIRNKRRNNKCWEDVEIREHSWTVGKNVN